MPQPDQMRVDDDPDLIRERERTLSRQGAVVLGASNGGCDLLEGYLFAKPGRGLGPGAW